MNPVTSHTGGDSGESRITAVVTRESGDSWRGTLIRNFTGWLLLLQVPVQLAQVVITHALGTWALDFDVVAQKRIFSELR